MLFSALHVDVCVRVYVVISALHVDVCVRVYVVISALYVDVRGVSHHPHPACPSHVHG